MTSKNLCFKLMWEDLKRRIWNIALLFLVLFFSLVIPVVYIGGTPMNGDMDGARWLAAVTENVLEILGGKNPLIAFIVVASALVCGISGFSYLHSAKKMDFYHSIPVKRDQLFVMAYFNGILMMAFIYLLNVTGASVIASTFGVELGVVFGTAIQAYLFHMAFYCLLYTTVVIAMMLTGNIIIALMGTAVFFAYVPAVFSLGIGYMSNWFQTYANYAGSSDGMVYLITHSSPFGYYMHKIGMYGKESVAAVVLAALLVSAVLAMGACLLYRHRPSEASGRAMAFARSMTPIKVLIVIPVAMAFSLFFHGLRNSFGWAVFGVLCGVLITHCLMEIIYHFDFRKLFSHRMHMAVCMTAGLLVLCGFQFDWFGYDTYLPRANQVETASVHVRSLDDWVTYGSAEQDESREYYYWKYENGEDYSLEHMELTDPSDVIHMAELGIQYMKDGDAWGNADYRGNGIWKDSEELERYVIQYTLKNGRKVRRTYHANRSAIEDTLEQIHDSEAYKTGTYPLMLQTPEETVRVNFRQYGKLHQVPERVDTSELLAAYKAEFMNLSYETRKKEIPTGTIQFVRTDMDKALATAQAYTEGYYYASAVDDRCYYPVYPSFSKTLQLLKEAGVMVAEGLDSEEISQIVVQNYASGYEDENGGYIYRKNDEKFYTFTGREELDALASALVYTDYSDMNQVAEIDRMDYVDATVIMSDGRKINCYFNSRKMPGFLTERLEEGRRPE